MSDSMQESRPEQALMREMGLTSENIERRKTIVGLSAADSTRIAALRKIVQTNVEGLASMFFDYLGGLGEAKALFGNRDLLQQARRLKSDHLSEMVRGEYGSAYVEQRLKLAMLYSKVGLETHAFLGAFHHVLDAIGVQAMKDSEQNPMEGFQNFLSLKKAAVLDVGIIVDAIIFQRERIILQQQEEIRELSTPVLQIRDQLLIIPVVGMVDTHRARLLTEGLLQAIRDRRAKGVVMDITGVPIVDSKVANHLAQACEAARLMGALVVLTGISSEIALTLVTIGAQLRGVRTVGDLQGGIEEIERFLADRSGARLREDAYGDDPSGGK